MKKNNLCSEIAYMSLNHDGEQLCGDHVEIVENENSTMSSLPTDSEAALRRAYSQRSHQR